MANSKSDYLVPANYHGHQNDVEHEVVLDGKKEAADHFKKTCERMFNINRWHAYSGFASSNFCLKNDKGITLERQPQVGDYIQVDIPAPGISSGGGYDWVKIELIDDHTDPEGAEESVGFRVRPSKNPNKPGDAIAHFLTPDATSVFIVQRKENKVMASYHGRNEVINTTTKNLPDKIRNTLIATGDHLGLGSLQWSSLTKGFLEKDE